jgi:hypothetical protein
MRRLGSDRWRHALPHGTGRLPAANRPAASAVHLDENVSRPETTIEGAGTSLKATMDILNKYGAVQEALQPFHIETAMYLGDENTFYASAATRRIAAYFNLAKDLTNGARGSPRTGRSWWD